jgi:hypothetical protein
MNPIHPRTKLVRNNSLTTAELDGEVVMLGVEMSRYYGLNPVGSRIWALLAQPMAFEDLCATLLREYDVSSEQCEREVQALAQKLIDEKLVHIV